MSAFSRNKHAALFAIVTIGCMLCHDPAAHAQTPSVQPSQTAPTTDSKKLSVELQIDGLFAAAGVFERIQHQLGNKADDPNQLFDALKRGAVTFFQAVPITTIPGTPAVCEELVQVPYAYVPWNGPGAIQGETALFQQVRNDITIAPTFDPDGACHLSVSITRRDVPNKIKPGATPTYSIQTTSIETDTREGDTVLLADLKPKRGYGRNFEEMVFVTVESIKPT